MKNLLNWAWMLPVIASVSLTCCSKDDDVVLPTPSPTPTSPVEGKTLLFMQDNDSANVTVGVYADGELTVGYNNLYMVMYEKGTVNMLSDGHVTFEPYMNMHTGMTHACPVESPHDPTPDNGVYHGAAVFIMPSGSSTGDWKLKVSLHNHANNQDGEVEGDITVKAPSTPRLYSFISPVDSASYFVSLVEPSSPEVGLNDFEVTVHKRESMMNFPFESTLQVEIEPEMPTMGHGSPDNVNPIHYSMGHYKGTVNFTMTGYWKVNMTIKDANGTVLNDANSFDITF